MVKFTQILYCLEDINRGRDFVTMVEQEAEMVAAVEAGCQGGQGTGNNGGGGGASGYQSGQIELLPSSVLPEGTQLRWQ